MPIEDLDLEKLVHAWLLGAEAERDSDEFKKHWWATEKVLTMHYDNPNLLWKFILMTYKRKMPERTEAYFAAQPLEDLIANHGEKYVDRIVELAEKDPLFKELLGGVWKSKTPDEVWSKIEAVHGEEWEP